ncbi:hypothetical protein BSPA14S_H0003 (plasmid) [Borreliella spielmanii A14S]|uniref:Uncharacterized protein n=1 Tax=Borreliella spielmanii A14S TaxID=498742 RepID=C0RCC9_9SPIR|nr:hypothetical protein BSPA14S_H0003 [Borreliella spielmanii A14S]
MQILEKHLAFHLRSLNQISILEQTDFSSRLKKVIKSSAIVR